MYEQSESIAELATALSKFQGEVESATKSSKNSHLKNSYATLEDIWSAVRSPLATNGLSVTQFISMQEQLPILVTQLNHASGQWIRSSSMLLQGDANRGVNVHQAQGSAITYQRRYALAGCLGITQEDDDGVSASGGGSGSGGNFNRNKPTPPKPTNGNGGATAKPTAKATAKPTANGAKAKTVADVQKMAKRIEDKFAEQYPTLLEDFRMEYEVVEADLTMLKANAKDCEAMEQWWKDAGLKLVKNDVVEVLG